MLKSLFILCFYVHYIMGIFFAGRIPPGQFEYANLNGWMFVEDARLKCDNDNACGGFTFKGSFNTKHLLMEIYFFHIVQLEPCERKEEQFLYWSTYKANKSYIVIQNTKIQPFPQNSIKTNLR